MPKKRTKKLKTFQTHHKIVKPLPTPTQPSYLDTLAYKIQNTLTPPFSILIDTNFINFCIKRKIDLKNAMFDCLNASFTFYVTDCVIGELEKLGKIYRVALNIVKSDMFKRLGCDHAGTYVDDCLIRRVRAVRCYLVATCDTELKNRIRKVPGVPIIFILGRKFVAEKI